MWFPSAVVVVWQLRYFTRENCKCSIIVWISTITAHYLFLTWYVYKNVHLFSFFVLSYYVYLCSEFRVVMSVKISHKTMFGSSLPPVVCGRAPVLFMLFVWFLFAYSGVQYISCCVFVLFEYSGVQHISCCVFALLFFVLCTLCCQFLWTVHFWLPIRSSLTFFFATSAYSCQTIFFCFMWSIFWSGENIFP